MNPTKNIRHQDIEQSSTSPLTNQREDGRLVAREENVLSSPLILEELVDLSNTYVPDGCEGNLD